MIHMISIILIYIYFNKRINAIAKITTRKI